MLNVLPLTKKLIAYNTVSHLSNEICIGFLEDTLRLLGFATTLHVMTGQTSPQINLIAKKGEGVGGLLLSGHSDTVPFRPEQKANLTAFQEGARLYGRGSCDMKGAIAAQLVAAQQTKHLSLKKPLTLVFTCQEEIGCLGAKALIHTPYINSEFAIIGEPTSLSPIRMHKGYIGLEVSIRGKAAHSSQPAWGNSAIKGAARAILALENLERELTQETYRPQPGAFQPDCCTVNVGVLHGGVARNVIAENALFTVELRPLPGQEISALIQRASDAINHALLGTGLTWGLKKKTTDKPMITPEDSAVVGFLKEQVGAEHAGSISFGTEGKEFNQMGLQTAIFGPGSIDKAHQEDEYVPLDELEATVDHYAAAIHHFCT